MENKNFAFGGITRSIGGAVCADGDLHTAVDVCNDGAGLQLLEKPRELFELENGETLLCIHEPEGEEKHYITQWEVPVVTLLGAGDTPVDSGDPISADPVGEKILNDDTYSSESISYDPTAPLVPPSTPEDTITDDYTAWITNNTKDDNGGASYSPSSTVVGGHIYLCYWVLEGTEYVKKRLIDITPYGKVTAIQPMGNTLVCNHEGGANFPKEIRYWLWKAADNAYLGLGSKPPMINITFGLESTFEYYPKTESVINGSSYKRYGGINISSYPYTDTVPVYWGDSMSNAAVPPYDIYCENASVLSHWQSTFSIENVVSPDGKTDVAGMKVNWTTMALGAYNKFIAEQTKDNKFVFPFWVRYAYELYDGSLLMHSYPVLMIPNSRGPIFALDGRHGLRADRDDEDHSYEKVRIDFNGRVYGFSSKLMYELKALSQSDLERLQNWKDLIRGLNIYITPPIYNYKQGGQVLGWKCMDWRDPANNCLTSATTPWDKYYTIGKVKYTNEITSTDGEMDGPVSLYRGFSTILAAKGDTNRDKIFWPWVENEGTNDATEYPIPDYILDIPQKDDTEVMELHENAGQFYKFASIEYEKLIDIAEDGQSEKELEAGKKVLTTIANQDVMQDDNGSHDTMSADVLYGYNRRLNLANVEKIMHSPLLPSVQWAREYIKEDGDDKNYPYQVTIYAKNGAEIARLKSTDDAVNCCYPQHIFYPNTNAFEALITRDLDKFRIRLKEHKALNGAFWIADFLNTPVDINKYHLEGDATTEELNLPEANTIVDERNKIYTSETDNPFYVPFGNINIAGGGEVRALAAATTAMSQGQFGQHPMYTFTSEGVWAMTVSDTGGWATIQPVTRDVITAGTKPLSLDSTVVFLGDRGLLQLGGAETSPLSGAVRSYDYSTFSKVASLSDATNMDDLLAAANSLLAFPDVAVLTYDARSGRIYVTPENVEASWVYNLKSGLWTQATTHIDHQVTTYPECEGQQGNMIVEIGGELGYQKDKGFVITRPVKFDDGSVLRRIHELAVRGQFRPYGPHTVQGTPVPGAIQTALWGTRDWVDHALVASSKGSRITRWGGSPYFGHSVGVFITQPADYLLHVVGVDAAIDMEHYNKLR